MMLKLSIISLDITHIYGPKTNNAEFYEDVQDHLEDANSGYSLICGDLDSFLKPRF